MDTFTCLSVCNYVVYVWMNILIVIDDVWN